jgi:hypothetical protein
LAARQLGRPLKPPVLGFLGQRRFGPFRAPLRFGRLDQTGTAEYDHCRPNAFFPLNEFRLEQFELQPDGPQLFPI